MTQDHDPIKIFGSTIDPEEMRVAIVQGGRLKELFVERMWERQKTGEIYKAKVDSVLPGMNSSFVNLGDGRNAFLYLGDARGLKLKQGSDVAVQISKTAIKTKGARVTTRLSIPGRYLVLVPGSRGIGVSRRIEDDKERHRLRSLVREMTKGLSVGVIVRTASEGGDKDVLESDFEGLLSLWSDIERNLKTQNAPCLIYRDLGLFGRVLRERFCGEVTEIITDNQEDKALIEEWLKYYGGGTNCSVELHKSPAPLFEFYGLEKEIKGALESRVWLKSGAYLVIEQTEALTVIDVNTGKFVGTSDLRDTVLSTNLDAAEEIAWQMRLRALGGIIVVDFIDMEDEEDRKTLIKRLEDLLSRDHCRTKVHGITHLGLVEITRKRERQDIRSVLNGNCPTCGTQSGVLKGDTVAASLKRFLRKISSSGNFQAFLIEMNCSLASYVADVYLSGWEELFGRTIAVRASESMAWDKFRVDFQGDRDILIKKIQGLREEGIVVYSPHPA